MPTLPRHLQNRRKKKLPASTKKIHTVSLSLLESLPAEVTRLILSHILLARNVRTEKPAICGEKHYRFETSILYVSKVLHDHASTYLYSANTFVRIKYQANATIGRFLNVCNTVPALAIGKHLTNFTRHAIDIEIFNMTTQHRDPDKGDSDDDDAAESLPDGHIDNHADYAPKDKCRMRCHCAGCDPTTVWVHKLITHENLSAFCTSVQLCNHFETGGHVVILEHGTLEHMHQPPPDSMSSFQVILKSRAPFLPELEPSSELLRQAELLRPFTMLCGGPQIYRYAAVGFKNQHHDLLDELEGHTWIGPVAKDGVGWDLLKILRAIKASLDEMTLETSKKHVVASLAMAYRTLSFHAEDNTMTFMRLAKFPEDEPEALASWQLGLACLERDCKLTAARCFLRADQPKDAMDELFGALDREGHIPKLNDTTQLKARVIYDHFVAIAMYDAVSADMTGLDPSEVEGDLFRATMLDPSNSLVQKDLQRVYRRGSVSLKTSAIRQYPKVINTDWKLTVPELPERWRGTRQMVPDEIFEKLERSCGFNVHTMPDYDDSDPFDSDDDDDDDEDDSGPDSDDYDDDDDNAIVAPPQQSHTDAAKIDTAGVVDSPALLTDDEEEEEEEEEEEDYSDSEWETDDDYDDIDMTLPTELEKDQTTLDAFIVDGQLTMKASDEGLVKWSIPA